jgi:hypothetical protein
MAGFAQQPLTRGFLVSGYHAEVPILIHRYEDQLTEAEQLVDVIRAEERCSHRFVRWAARRPLPELTAPDRVADLVVSWQQREPLPGDMGLAA